MPTFSRKRRRSAISRTINRAMWRSVSLSSTFSSQASAPRAESAQNSLIGVPETSTDSDSGRSRAPLQSGHGRTLMYSSIFSRASSESVSR